MKKYVCFLLFTALLSCNSAIEVSPITGTSEDNVVDTFDYNFVATPDFERLLPRLQRYSSVIELYYNPFDEIDKNTTATFKFDATKFSTFIIDKDTLYPGDQIKFPVSKFVSRRIYAEMFTIQKDNITTTLSLTIRKNTKTKTINYTLL